MSEFEDRISRLDIGLFDQIPSQSTDFDRASLLACELAVRELVSGYTYLEIGSYLGGSIQPHLLDNKCSRIYSIDKRPESQPDARGFDWVYQNNSTARMLELLKAVNPNIEKIVTIDGDTATIDPAEVAEKVDLCFIDGEHTDEAVFRDFCFCLEVLADNGAILFHDSQITYNGIAACINYLKERSTKFHGYILPNLVFVIEIGDFPVHRNSAVMERLIDNHNSYIYSLQDVDKYRRFATRFPFGFLRRALIKVRGTNVSQ